jgi:hypothetical protein
MLEVDWKLKENALLPKIDLFPILIFQNLNLSIVISLKITK